MAKYKYSKYNKTVLMRGEDYMAEDYPATSVNIPGTSKMHKLNLTNFTLSTSTVNASKTVSGDIFTDETNVNNITNFNAGTLSIGMLFKKGTMYYRRTTNYFFNKSDFSFGKGSFIEEIIAEDGTFPNDGLHSDGFYYVKGALATIPINILVNGTFVDSEKAYVNVNGVWKEILEFHQVQNNKWINLLDGSINDPVGVNLLLNSNTAILGEQVAEFGFDEFEVKNNRWGRNVHYPWDYNSSTTSRDAIFENNILRWTQKDTSTTPFILWTYAPTGVFDYVFSFKSDNSENIRNYINTSASGTKYGTIITDSHYEDGVLIYDIAISFIEVDVYYYINFYGTNPFEPIKEVKFWDLKIEKGNQATPWSPSPEVLTQGYEYILAQNLQPNQYYTFSTNYSGKWQGLWIDNKFIGYLNNGKITFKLPISINQGANVVVKILDSSFVITHAKLEEGEEATNWSPSP